ncbi:MAG: hypothetical protein M1817_002387 [Caeruleum heppii]|nr:MAG: hypothetical protein M1817_002387 [Caeruleum heppii]
MALQTDPGGKVDRQSTVPFHLKLFYRTGGFLRLEDFHSASPSTLPPHLQIYTWPSCTLRELSHLLTTALPSLLPSPMIGTRLSFRLIFPDTRDAGRPGPGRYLSKELGSVVIGATDGAGILPDDEEAKIVAGGPMAGELGGEPDKTLQEVRFVIGDYISCAVFPPLANGAVAPPSAAYAGGRGMGNGPPRENGYGGFRVRGGGRPAMVPSGEWRRGERVPEGPADRGFGRGRGRGRY